MARPSRNSRRSSTIATRIVSVIVMSVILRLQCAGAGATTNCCSLRRLHQGNNCSHRSTMPGSGVDCQASAKRGCAAAHARESVAIAIATGIETFAIIVHDQTQHVRIERQLDLRLIADRVTHRVVYALLENEEDLTAQIAFQTAVLFLSGQTQGKCDIPRCKS